MNVKELVAILKKCDPEMEVALEDSNEEHYTGPILGWETVSIEEVRGTEVVILGSAPDYLDTKYVTPNGIVVR